MAKKTLIRKAKDTVQTFYHTRTFSALALAFTGLTALSYATLPATAATIAVGFISLGSYAAYERKRRNLWERAQSFKTKNQRKKTAQKPKIHTGSLRQAEPLNIPQKIEEQQETTHHSAAPISRFTQNSRRYDQIAMSEDIIFEDIKSEEKFGGNTVITPRKEAEPTFSAPPSDAISVEYIERSLRTNTLHVVQKPLMDIARHRAYSYILSASVETPDGTMPADTLQRIAKEYKLTAKIQTALLNHIINKIEHGSSVHYTLPITQTTLRSQSFINTLLAYFKTAPQQAEQQITLKLSWDDFSALSDKDQIVMSTLARIHCQFMVGNVTSTDINPRTLRALNIRTISIPMGFIEQHTQDSDSYKHMIQLRRDLESQSIRVVIDDVNSEMALRNISALSPRYALGGLYSESETKANVELPRFYH